MQIQTLLDLVTDSSQAQILYTPAAFIGFLKSDLVTSCADPFTRLLQAALAAGSQANAVIAGHQAAIRRLFPSTPQDAVTAFCVSEKRGPHPRYIETQLTTVNDQLCISGEKMWGTMAPVADVLYVATSTGVVDGQNQLSMVSVSAQHASVTQIPLPPERQAGDVPICDLRFTQTPVLGNRSFEGDAYTRYIKPFRLVEDVYSTVAMQIALWRLGAKTALSAELREDLLGLIVQGHAVSESGLESPGDVLLLTSYLRASQAHWLRLADSWHERAPEVASNWQVSRPILQVAARARATRRESAWQTLGEPLSAQIV